VRQIVIEISPEDAGSDIDELGGRVMLRAEQWAAACIQERSELGELGSEL
jgi:hypothetical protein